MQHKRGLLTDDLGLRAIAQECGIPCTWTQTFLQVQVRSGLLSPMEYQNGLSALLASQYDFTQLGHVEILAELRSSDWTINDRLRRFAAVMARPNVDRASLAGVLAELTIESRVGEPTSSSVAAFHIALVDALQDAGSTRDIPAIYEQMLGRLKQGFFRILVGRRWRSMLLQTTNLIPPDTLAGEMEETALALTRGTWTSLLEGGLRIQSQFDS